MERRWGTWEELVLGGAVLRHGTRAWDTVASELRTRSACPYGFSPQECEAKYEDLQDRYSGCSSWFEELRKQRVAELKRELERSEGSIGSLQSKIHSLVSGRGATGSLNINMQQALPADGANGTESESPPKEQSKDAMSAGSFTEDTLRDWSPKVPVPATDSALENAPELKDCEELDQENVCILGSEMVQGNVKKRRGKRKRKEHPEVKEAASVGENEVLSATAVKVKDESSTGACEQNAGPSCTEEVGLVAILDSFMGLDCAQPFRRHLETQNRNRYKRLIRQHADFGTIRARVVQGSVSSIRELYRDLLLLCNNALVFFPRHSLEHASALALRRSVTRRLRAPPSETLTRRSSVSASDYNHIVLPPKRNPVKPRSARPWPRKPAPGRVTVVVGDDVGSREEQPASVFPAKKGVGRPAKGPGSRGGRRRAESGERGRKRARRR